MAIKATLGVTSAPVVTRIVKGQSSVDDISGLNVDYATVQNGDVLGYNAASNTFTTVAAAVNDQGVFNNGSF